MEPSLATELAENLAKAPNLSAASAPPQRVVEAAVADPVAAPASSNPDPKPDPPRKKPKAPRPEAGLGGFCFLV